MIKTWEQRCEEHPNHQSGMVSHGMIQARMQEEIDALRAALAQPIISPEIKGNKAAAQEIERLSTALRYEENRFSRIGTHGPDCWKWGPGHYECAMRHIKGTE
jgi:hypothetical protein